MTAPKLRFQEFDGNWESNQLGKIIGISSASRVFKEQWQDSGVPFFRTSDVVSIFKNKENEKAYISLELFEELAKKSGKINKDDLLVTGGGTIGIPYLVPNDQPLYFKDADLLWMKSSGVIKGSFLYNFLISPKFREYLNSISHTGTISHFTIEQAKATPFSFPSKKEQTKIATFLSAVDEKISQLSQKLHLLGQYKQGMMQKLFSQQIRFKADDDREFMEWEEKELKNVVEINPKAKKLPENFIYIDLESVEKGRLLLQKNIALQDAPSRAQRLLAKGDVLFQMVRPYQQNNYYFNLSGEYVASTGYAQIRTKLDSKFIYYALHEKTFLDEVMNRCTGTSYPAINSSDLSSIEILIPCLEEQTKIANFLSAIDQKIDVVSEQLEQAKLWKKGLLQQMFV